MGCAPVLSNLFGNRETFCVTQMHLLITNDDGPPELKASPYVYGLVQAIRRVHPDWDVSVALPHTQRSWIGKSHFISQPVSVTYYRPGKSAFEGTVHKERSEFSDDWALLDGTPASAAQIGIHHLFRNKGPVDLVISGPNFGRNSTALFAMSSGTIGAAMEASLCGVKAIALSFAHFGPRKDWGLISQATDLAVKLCLHLYNDWNVDTDIYSINIPLNENVEDMKILYTSMLHNKWGSCFAPVERIPVSPADKESEIRKSETTPTRSQISSQYEWKPSMRAVAETVEKAPPGNDGWAVQNATIGVTPLKSAFQGVPLHGELKL